MEQQNTRESLESVIRTVEEQIKEFNAHWLNHKHIMSACAATIMALIFIGMLIKSIELYLWGLSGVLVLVFICAMVWRNREADRLNTLMMTAQDALKAYEKGRRKKKK